MHIEEIANAMAGAVAVQGTWAAMPDDLKAGIPSGWVTAVSIAVLVLGAVGRFIKQGSSHADDSTE